MKCSCLEAGSGGMYLWDNHRACASRHCVKVCAWGRLVPVPGATG